MPKIKPSNTSSRTREVYDSECYICNDPSFARVGLPLCYPCPVCGEHIAADDTVCKNGHNAMVYLIA